MKKASELCETCKPVYDSWSNVSPETARAIKKSTGTKSLTDFFIRQQDAVREACTAHTEEAVRDRHINEVTQYHHED